MQLILVILSIVGVLLSIAGWVIERAFKLEWLRRRICTEADTALRALEALRADPKLGIEHNDPAFAVLSAAWPRFPDRPPIRAIGRTVAYVEFGSEVKNQIGLTLFDERLNHVEGHDWTISEANDALVAPIEKRFRYVGITVFFVGVAVTIAAAIVRFASVV